MYICLCTYIIIAVPKYIYNYVCIYIYISACALTAENFKSIVILFIFIVVIKLNQAAQGIVEYL